MALWGNQDSKTASGTIAIASNGVVTGTGTSFTTQAKIGNTIRAGGVDYEIVTITSNTVCKVESGVQGGAIAVVNAGASYTLSTKPAFIAASESATTSGVAGDSNKVYGVDTTEIHAGGDNIVNIAIVDGGNKYRENQIVFAVADTNSVGQAVVNPTTGKVTSVTLLSTGSGFNSVPNVYTLGAHYTIPTAGINTTSNTITYNNHPLDTGDFIRYLQMGGTAATGQWPGQPNGSLQGYTAYVRKTGTNTFKVYVTLAGATEDNGATPTIPTSAVNVTSNTINFASPHGYSTGDEVFYNAGGSTKITLSTGNLSDATAYFVVKISDNDIKLATTKANAIATVPVTVDITGTGNNAQFLTTSEVDITGTGNNSQRIMLANDGDTKNTAADNKATFSATLGSGDDGDGGNAAATVTHSGWVRRTVGTGGRAGRVQYETLVAMGSMTGDQADDRQFPDA
jgi:hypothetical protein